MEIHNSRVNSRWREGGREGDRDRDRPPTHLTQKKEKEESVLLLLLESERPDHSNIGSQIYRDRVDYNQVLQSSACWQPAATWESHESRGFHLQDLSKTKQCLFRRVRAITLAQFVTENW